MSDEQHSAPDEQRRTLLLRATQGDETAVQRLLQEYLPRVHAFVRLRMDRELRARESISDVVQSVCVDLVKRQDNFEYRGEAEFRSWLFQAALNKVREKQRFHGRDKRDLHREHRPDTIGLEQVYATLGTPSRDMMAQEQMQALESAFDKLPADYREVVTLARLVGLPHDQIAEQMGKSVGAVRQMLGRALIKLGEFLDDGGG